VCVWCVVCVCVRVPLLGQEFRSVVPTSRPGVCTPSGPTGMSVVDLTQDTQTFNYPAWLHPRLTVVVTHGGFRDRFSVCFKRPLKDPSLKDPPA